MLVCAFSSQLHSESCSGARRSGAAFGTRRFVHAPSLSFQVTHIMKTSLIVAAVAASAVSSFSLAGSVVMDGAYDKAYGAPLSTQDNQTQFGDSNLGLIDRANGSELDVGYGFVDNDGFLRLLITGNLESNFNKLEVFIDYKEGGQNRLRGDNPDVDFNGLNRMGDDGTGIGLTFDRGFAADYYITTTCGGDSFSTYANTAQILTKGGGTGEYIGSGGAGAGAVLNGSNGTLIALDNSNVAGVLGGTDFGSGEGVLTGIEIALPLSLIGDYAGGDIKVCVAVNAGGHDFLSNQILGGVGGGIGNLGEPRLVNFDAVPGLQYFVIPGGGGGSCVGDLTGNGTVDAEDLAFLLGGWGNASGDLDGNGTTDASDLALLLGGWGACP